MDKKSLLLIDGSSILYRAFFALPSLKREDGLETGAIYGFCQTLFRFIEQINPFYIICCLDSKGPTFRHKEFKAYKIKRPPLPKKLEIQIPHLKKILKVLKVKILEKKGYEADDLIAEIVRRVKKKLKIFILTGDLDLLQLAEKDISVIILKRGKKEGIIYSKEKVKEKIGIWPAQIPDFKALAGDPSDNIPGVLGIGKKEALKLLKKYKNILEIYQKIEEIEGRVQAKLKKGRERAFLSRKLALLSKRVPLSFSLKEARWGIYDLKEVEKIFAEYQFFSLRERLILKRLI